MVEEYAEVIVDGEKWTAVTPIPGKGYWLGYFSSNHRLGQDPMRGVDAKYFGIANDQHVFFALTSEGEVTRYTTPIGDSYLRWENHDGDEGPWLPFLPAKFDQVLPHGLQQEFVLTRLKELGELEKRASTRAASPRA